MILLIYKGWCKMDNLNVLKNEETLLSYTQQQRVRIYESLSASNQLTDPKVASVALKALEGLDKQTLTLKRLDIDQQGADNDKEVAVLLAKAAEQRTREFGNPFRVSGIQTTLPTAKDVMLGEHVFTEEELEENTTRTTASKFLTTYREENDLLRED